MKGPVIKNNNVAKGLRKKNRFIISVAMGSNNIFF